MVCADWGQFFWVGAVCLLIGFCAGMLFEWVDSVSPRRLQKSLDRLVDKKFGPRGGRWRE